MALQDYQESSFAYDGIERKVFKASPEGPSKRGIVVIHEILDIDGSAKIVFLTADAVVRIVDIGALAILPTSITVEQGDNFRLTLFEVNGGQPLSRKL